MVPHLKIEEEMHQILGDQPCVVIGIPTTSARAPRAALHQSETTPSQLWQRLSETSLPRLWVPKRENMYVVDSIPTLGTGKVDCGAQRRRRSSWPALHAPSKRNRRTSMQIELESRSIVGHKPRCSTPSKPPASASMNRAVASPHCTRAHLDRTRARWNHAGRWRLAICRSALDDLSPVQRMSLLVCAWVVRISPPRSAPSDSTPCCHAPRRRNRRARRRNFPRRANFQHAGALANGRSSLGYWRSGRLWLLRDWPQLRSRRCLCRSGSSASGPRQSLQNGCFPSQPLLHALGDLLSERAARQTDARDPYIARTFAWTRYRRTASVLTVVL